MQRNEPLTAKKPQKWDSDVSVPDTNSSQCSWIPAPCLLNLHGLTRMLWWNEVTSQSARRGAPRHPGRTHGHPSLLLEPRKQEAVETIWELRKCPSAQPLRESPLVFCDAWTVTIMRRTPEQRTQQSFLRTGPRSPGPASDMPNASGDRPRQRWLACLAGHRTPPAAGSDPSWPSILPTPVPDRPEHYSPGLSNQGMELRALGRVSDDPSCHLHTSSLKCIPVVGRGC